MLEPFITISSGLSGRLRPPCSQICINLWLLFARLIHPSSTARSDCASLHRRPPATSSSARLPLVHRLRNALCAVSRSAGPSASPRSTTADRWPACASCRPPGTLPRLPRLAALFVATSTGPCRTTPGPSAASRALLPPAAQTRRARLATHSCPRRCAPRSAPPTVQRVSSRQPPGKPSTPSLVHPPARTCESPRQCAPSVLDLSDSEGPPLFPPASSARRGDFARRPFCALPIAPLPASQSTATGPRSLVSRSHRTASPRSAQTTTALAPGRDQACPDESASLLLAHCHWSLGPSPTGARSLSIFRDPQVTDRARGTHDHRLQDG